MEAGDDTLTTTQIFVRLKTVAAENRNALIGWVLVLAVVNTAFDQYDSAGVSNLPSGILSIVAQYRLTGTALERQGLRSPGTGLFGSFFVLGLVSGLAMLLGAIFLLVPALILAVRWFVADAVLLAEHKTVGQALSDSWEMTGHSFWPIFGVYLVLVGPAFILAIGLSVALATVWPVAITFISYLLLHAAFGISWLAGVATYALLRPQADPLAEIFA